MPSPRTDSTAYPGYSQDGMTSTTIALSGVDQSLTLNNPSGNIRFQLSAGSAICYLGLQKGDATAATTADFALPPGGSYDYKGPPLSKFHFLGASALGTLSVLAF